MKFISFKHNNEAKFGIQNNKLITDITYKISGAKTLKDLIAIKNTTTAKASLLTAIFEDPTGYGRVIRNSMRKYIHVYIYIYIYISK